MSVDEFFRTSQFLFGSLSLPSSGRIVVSSILNDSIIDLLTEDASIRLCLGNCK